ncbi:hypothetical protein [Castellaniella denitrificans]|uniref:hypothetical protein n=1 Tax=Castellaniella denitrificans TaxID=56119 RepID=UPI001AC210A4|nr:hypothetical protein [Burkholderiales bacterium]
MRTPVAIRDEYLDSLTHIRVAYNKVCQEVGRGHLFTFPDVHKLSEGLFISALTYWEAFCKDVITTDLATRTVGTLCSEVKTFRTKNAPYRLAERILNHPDHPTRFVEWSSFQTFVDRANAHLGSGYRFALPQPTVQNLAIIKKIRNAIAHKSDKAWTDFSTMIRKTPFNLTSSQCKGVTPGRFIYATPWSGTTVMLHTLATLENAANTIVP